MALMAVRLLCHQLASGLPSKFAGVPYHATTPAFQHSHVNVLSSIWIMGSDENLEPIPTIRGGNGQFRVGAVFRMLGVEAHGEVAVEDLFFLRVLKNCFII
jgi:hypothetical protein